MIVRGRKAVERHRYPSWAISLNGNVLKEIRGGFTPADALLRRAPMSDMTDGSDPSYKHRCEEWRPWIERGKIDALDLREGGSGYKY